MRWPSQNRKTAPQILGRATRALSAARGPHHWRLCPVGMVLVSASSAAQQQQRKIDAAFQNLCWLFVPVALVLVFLPVASALSIPATTPASPGVLRWSAAPHMQLAHTHAHEDPTPPDSAFPLTCVVLQEELGALRELGVWDDLSFGQQVNSASGGGLGMGIGRRSAERERGEKGGRFDDMLMLRALLAACPRLTHLDLACFTRPTFSFRELSRTLQTSAPHLESFTLVKMHKSSEDSEFAGPSGASPKAAVRLAAENPRLRSFKICTTLDVWLNPREGRVKVLGVYGVVSSSAGCALSASGASLQDLSSSRESIMSGSGPQSAPASITHFSTAAMPSTAATAPTLTTAMLHAHEYGQRNLTGRMYSRHLVVPVAPKERPLSYGRGGSGAPPSSFLQNLTHSMYASLPRVGSITSTFQIPEPQQHQQTPAAATTTPTASHSRWGSKLKGHRRAASSDEAIGSASASVSPSAWGSVPTAGSGSGSRSRRSSISNVVGSIAYALVGMKHGHGHADKERKCCEQPWEHHYGQYGRKQRHGVECVEEREWQWE
ncbi:hypothetical protein D9619_000397 [Psilocybe cf. subviscida]|uniref:Uncharacterized protein n=1 Tax=Psilocybe cf. subviscida TaxID=2480587 RepID=A0A8H5F3S4_9AGAR|nr:hypothetical protein D9619_000397 [Psilocybe cf. subviscida]